MKSSFNLKSSRSRKRQSEEIHSTLTFSQPGSQWENGQFPKIARNGLANTVHWISCDFLNKQTSHTLTGSLQKKHTGKISHLALPSFTFTTQGACHRVCINRHAKHGHVPASRNHNQPRGRLHLRQTVKVPS